MFSSLARSELSDRAAWRIALAVAVVMALVRLVVLFASPIQLYPDEAQYWVWSRDLAWGYFSKPPMVAWLIALTTAVGGDGEAWVRLSSIFLHAGSSLLLFETGRRLYGARTGLLTALIYGLMPGVQLSAGIASTDAALMFFLSVALLAYVRLLEAGGRRAGVGWAALLGAGLGLAFLSKYAAIYAVIGLVLHALSSGRARRAWRPGAILAAAGLLLLILAPNLGWNARNHFATIGHTAANADWSATNFFHPLELAGFVASQFGVFGPLPFFVLVLGAALTLGGRSGGRREGDGLLLCLAAPPILAVCLQALLSRANANWAFAAYGPGSVLAAAWLVRWGARRWTGAGLALQAALAAAFLAGAAHPPLADALGLGNSLKRSRGWAEMTDAVLDRAAGEPAATAVAVDSRFLYNEMRYYGRDRLAAPGAPALRMWVRENRPQNHAELTAPLRPSAMERVLGVSLTPEFEGEFMRDFRGVWGRPPLSVRLDRKRARDAGLFVGQGFSPRPRDHVTGLPTPP